MKLLALMPHAFGKFTGTTEVKLEDGLNIVRGGNESGKSTLGAFILGMFYGFKKDGKTRISRSPEFDRYRPWSGTDYRGAMTYEEGGRVYRVERSFDPDVVKVFDNATGEDLTRRFTQDSRKEYDFASRHLGLSQKEFRNTIWVGQLGSAQESDLGTEIQSKLENVLQGGAEEVSLTRALGALAEEKAKIKAPRSTKAKLDLVSSEIERLEGELAVARTREEQVREWLSEATDLTAEKDRLQGAVDKGTADLQRARRGMLQDVLAAVSKLDDEAGSARERVQAMEWASDLPPDCEQNYRDALSELENVERRISEIKAEGDGLAERRAKALESLESLRAIESTGVDEVAVAALHSRYGLAKAQAMRGERATNEARRELRLVEEEGRTKGYPSEDLNEDVIRMAEDHQRNCVLAEKEKDRLEIEAERARAAVSEASTGDSSTLFYAIALVILGLAVVCTVMGLPYGVPLFACAVVVFALGARRRSAHARVRAEAREALSAKEEELAAQVERIESAQKVLSEFLYAVGAKSVEELRSLTRDITLYQSRLAAARDRFETVQKAWFEASGELSAAEKELLSHLRAANIVQAADPVTDASVDRLRKLLREMETQKNLVRTLDDRVSEVASNLARQESLRDAALKRKAEILSSVKVGSGEEMEEKIAACAGLEEASKAVREIEARRDALLSGRDISDIRREVLELSQGDSDASQTGGEAAGGPAADSVTDRRYESLRKALDADKSRLYEAGQKLAALERGIRIRGEEGRTSTAVTEDLSRLRAVEDELSLERDALELAQNTLSELSAGIRREFAPALSERAEGVLECITGGRYTQARISPDLEMSVIHPDTKGQVPISALSSGTLDQCYFALRIAIAEAVTKKDNFPLFLDDSFAQYDDLRLEGALRVLAGLATKHQVVVFSCQTREEDAAARLGLTFNKVAL